VPPHGGQALAGDRHHVRGTGGQPHAVIAADQDAVARRGLADVEDCRQRNTGGHFDHGRVSRGTAHAEQDRPRLFRRADRGEALGPEQGEHRQLGERRRVGQQRGQVRDAEIAGQDLASRRDWPLAVDAADQRAGFSRDEPVGHLGHAGYLAQAGLGRDGRLQRPVRQLVARDPDHDLLGPDGLGHKRGTAEDEVGRADHEHLVFDAARLALGGVDDHDRRAVVVLRVLHHRAELAREGKRRTTLAAQVDLLGHGDQFLGGEPGQRAEDVAVGFQIEPGHPVEAGRQPGSPDPHDRRRVNATDRAHCHS